jgi:hypothetical protein
MNGRETRFQKRSNLPKTCVVNVTQIEAIDRAYLLMSSLFRDYVASVRPRGEPFRSRSMVLCLAGHHPVLSIGGNARRQGLKTTFALLCPRSPGLTPRSLFGYSIVDSSIIQKIGTLSRNLLRRVWQGVCLVTQVDQ